MADRAIVALVRGEPGDEYSDAMRRRAQELWSGHGSRNASATARLLARELPEGERVPTEQCIRKWARDESWAATADLDFAALLASGTLLPDLKRQMVQTYL